MIYIQLIRTGANPLEFYMINKLAQAGELNPNTICVYDIPKYVFKGVSLGRREAHWSLMNGHSFPYTNGPSLAEVHGGMNKSPHKRQSLRESLRISA